MAAGVNSTKGVNVHSIALEVPKTQLTKGRAAPTDAAAASSVIGVWTTASRQKARVLKAGGVDASSGPYVQVSRLGNPLVNEVVVPMSKKDYWNAQPPDADKQFTPAVLDPELAQLLPVLYPGVFPNLEAYNKGTPKRDDLVAIFHTGIPTGVVPGFQNSGGTTQADMLRLNMAIRRRSQGANNLGLLGNDIAGYPNGRRVFDDVVTIALRAVAGDAAVGRQELQARRRGERHHRWAHRERHRPERQRRRSLPVGFPLPGCSVQRIRGRSELSDDAHARRSYTAGHTRGRSDARPESRGQRHGRHRWGLRRRGHPHPGMLNGLEIEIRPVGRGVGRHAHLGARAPGARHGDLGGLLRVPSRGELRASGAGRRHAQPAGRRPRRRSDGSRLVAGCTSRTVT